MEKNNITARLQLNRAQRRIGMTPNAEKICGSMSEGFAPHVIEQETIVLWKPHYLFGLHQGKVVCPVSTEKERLKESSVSCTAK